MQYCKSLGIVWSRGPVLEEPQSNRHKPGLSSGTVIENAKAAITFGPQRLLTSIPQRSQLVLGTGVLAFGR